MPDAVAWLLRRARTWAALGAAATATLLASGDGKAAWTAGVGVSTFGLALLSMRAHWLDEHPDRSGQRRARHEDRVAEIVRRYEEQADARRAALKQPSRPE